MKLLHYLEIENFKTFGRRQKVELDHPATLIELDHPATLIGPNNCGKTTAIQAIALWSQAVQTWLSKKGESRPSERTSTAINRLDIVAIPVHSTRYFWHNMVVRNYNIDVHIKLTVGIEYRNQVRPVVMKFRNYGSEIVYCTPDEATRADIDLIRAAARISIRILYPMSGLDMEEPVLRKNRIDVLLGQGKTAQVLRNLCLIVHQDQPECWTDIVKTIERLFSITLSTPIENTRGSIDLRYRQSRVKDPLDISMAGRGLQQMLLIFSYLFSHRQSVLLIDEPDAHLEILRQRQVFVLLRDIATRNESQVILVTHSEVILDEALDQNLTLILDNRAENLAKKGDIRNALKFFGAENYIKANQCKHVLYVEGRTDMDILREFAKHLEHPVEAKLNEHINAFYLQDNFPERSWETELSRVEGGFGGTHEKHFFSLRSLIPELRGLAIIDGDGKDRQSGSEGDLRTVFWSRYEIENYFISPEVLREYVVAHYGTSPILCKVETEIQPVLDGLMLELVFNGSEKDLNVWKGLKGDEARLLWEALTKRVKLSNFAEEFFRRLANAVGDSMLLRKGELFKLVRHQSPASFDPEVKSNLDVLNEVLSSAIRPD